MRLYLEQDQLDVRAAPSFVMVHKEERDLNAVKFSLQVEKIEVEPSEAEADS